MTPYPDLLALDFDGVLCDGMREYFHTAWRVYRQVWSARVQIPPTGLAERFARLRPVIESGWEMPLLLRALLLGYDEEQLFNHWADVSKAILTREGLSSSNLGVQFNADRDVQIQEDEKEWLARNRFYPGVCERLRSILQEAIPLRIVTTKEERYSRRLLEQEQIYLPVDWIVGRSAKRSKHETLQRYQNEIGTEAGIWFVEDRLLTLQSIRRHPDLANVKLFLAEWGYNTPKERQCAGEQEDFHLLSLEAFCSNFSVW